MDGEDCYHGIVRFRYDIDSAFLYTAVRLGVYEYWLLVIDPLGNDDPRGRQEAWNYYTRHYHDGDPIGASGSVQNSDNGSGRVLHVMPSDDC